MRDARWEWLEGIETVTREGLVGWASFPPEAYASGDHFPGTPMVPGVLLAEAMAQAAGWWVAWGEGFVGKCVLARMDEVVFRSPASPGERVRVEVAGLPADGARRTVRCRVGREGRVMASALMGLRFFGFGEVGTPWRPPLDAGWMRARFELLLGR